MSKTTPKIPMAPAPAPASGSPAKRVLALLLYLALAVHLVLAVRVLFNQISSDVVLEVGDSFYMQTYVQYSRGQHNYYDADPHLLSGGYTPLAAEIFGLAIRVFGNDVRVVRGVAALFGIGLIFLAAQSVFVLTRSRLLAFAAFCLGFSLEPKWFLEIGPNVIHVFFLMAAIRLLLGAPAERFKTAYYLLGALFVFLSFWAKQTGLAYMPVYLFCVWFKDRKSAAFSLLLMAGLTALGFWRYIHLPDSKFIYYVFQNANQPLIWERLADPIFFPLLFGRFCLLVALAGIGLILCIDRFRQLLEPQFVFLGATCGIGLLTSLKYGSGMNQVWAFYVLLLVNALYFGHRLAAQGTLAPGVLHGLLAVQACCLFQPLGALLINREDEQRFAWLQRVLTTPGKSTYYINQGYLTDRWKGDRNADVRYDCWKNGVYDRSVYPARLREFVESDPFDLVVIDVPLEDGSFVLYERLNAAYEMKYELPPASRFADRGSLRYKKIVFEKKPAAAGPGARQ